MANFAHKMIFSKLVFEIARRIGRHLAEILRNFAVVKTDEQKVQERPLDKFEEKLRVGGTLSCRVPALRRRSLLIHHPKRRIVQLLARFR